MLKDQATPGVWREMSQEGDHGARLKVADVKWQR